MIVLDIGGLKPLVTSRINIARVLLSVTNVKERWKQGSVFF